MLFAGRSEIDLEFFNQFLPLTFGKGSLQPPSYVPLPTHGGMNTEPEGHPQAPAQGKSPDHPEYVAKATCRPHRAGSAGRSLAW